jgi:hypothetical protein
MSLAGGSEESWFAAQWVGERTNRVWETYLRISGLMEVFFFMG